MGCLINLSTGLDVAFRNEKHTAWDLKKSTSRVTCDHQHIEIRKSFVFFSYIVQRTPNWNLICVSEFFVVNLKWPECDWLINVWVAQVKFAGLFSVLHIYFWLARGEKGLFDGYALSRITSLAVISFESSSTQTAVSFVCKTSLTGCFVLARFLRTCVLGKKETMRLELYVPLFRS